MGLNTMFNREGEKVMTITMTPEKTTKNKVRFEEQDGKLDIIYIPKRTLKEICWKEGQSIEVEVRTKE